MGFLTGSASFVRFTVEGQAQEPFWDWVAERIAALSFHDIDDTIDEYSIGWVSVVNMFDADFNFASYAAADYVALSMRVDERKVSPSVLKKYVAKEEERIKLEREVPRLSRAARLEIRERVKAELVRKSPPIPAVYDLVWNPGACTVHFFSTNKKAIAQVEELFKETFSLNLALEVPYTSAIRLAGPGAAGLDALKPEVLV